MAAAIVHAAGESAGRVPVPTGTYAVALASNDLEGLSCRLAEKNISHKRIIENDCLVAIGCAPLRDRSQIRKVVSSLPLVR